MGISTLSRADLAASGSRFRISLSTLHMTHWEVEESVVCLPTGPAATWCSLPIPGRCHRSIGRDLVGMNVTSSCTLPSCLEVQSWVERHSQLHAHLGQWRRFLLVKEMAGRVHAYNAATGAPLWTAAPRLLRYFCRARRCPRHSLYWPLGTGFAGSNNGTIRAFRLGTPPHFSSSRGSSR